MGFLESILIWIAEKVLNYLLGRATDAVIEHEKEVARDKERGEINDANTKAYEEANDRAARIKAATDLLNRSRR